MSFMTDMALLELEDEFTALLGLLIAKEIITMEEYEGVLAEVKRLKGKENVKKKEELDDLFKDKKGTNA